MKRSGTAQSKGNRVVGYIRVSDESQVDGYSLNAQRTEITRWCDRQGHKLVGFYADEGVSAHTDDINKRPQLMRLLEYAKRRAFDIAVVHTLDRWARNVGVQRKAIQQLGDCRVGFASVAEDFDYTTPAGRLLLTTMGGCQNSSLTNSGSM
jgi:site-specific DNA recombinase